jgi:hypothetical protein
MSNELVVARRGHAGGPDHARRLQDQTRISHIIHNHKNMEIELGDGSLGMRG